MKIIKYYRKAGRWIRLGKRCISIGIILSLWVTTICMFDAISDASKMEENEKGGYYPSKNSIRSFQIAKFLPKSNFSFIRESNSHSPQKSGEKVLEIQELYRGALRKIESIGLDQEKTKGIAENINKEMWKTMENSSRDEMRIFVSNGSASNKKSVLSTSPEMLKSRHKNSGSHNHIDSEDPARCTDNLKYHSSDKNLAQQDKTYKERGDITPRKKSSISSQTQGKSRQNSVKSNSDVNLEFYERQLDKESLRKLETEGFLGYSYNLSASNGVDRNRSLPSTRPESCPQVSTLGLPKASVIICFHNEAVSVLLRTVSSVVMRSPPELLEEVILVDDNSTKGDSNSLEAVIQQWPKVSLIRTIGRQGLVRARLLGASQARGSVLVFLDSHCECNVDWLPPLLQAVHEDSSKVVSPYVDAIRADSFDYVPAPDNLHGGFTWRMEFIWKGIPPKVMRERSSPAQPIKTPTISGGLFAIDKEFFFHIGTYDEGLDIWGGENLELAFRVWMCGGSMEIIPCSRVGHVFRNILPYKFPSDSRRTILHNLGRVAEVWLDEYKEYFYAAVDFPPDLDLGDVTKRQRLREDLKCQSFQWYLDNIIPELLVPPREAHQYGEFRNHASLTCLTASPDKSKQNRTQLYLNGCLGQTETQLFYLTKDGFLRHGNQCVVPGDNKMVGLGTCGSHTWVADNLHLNLKNTDLCLTAEDNEFVRLSDCERQNDSQKWDVSYNFKWRRKNS